MNERQKIALKFPCFSPQDLVNPRYKKIVHFGSLRVSSVLTVSMQENPTWHVSGSILSPNNQPTKLFGNVSKTDFDKLFKHLQSLLEGVGEGQLSTFPPDTVLHFFKNLSADELEQVKKTSGYGN